MITMLSFIQFATTHMSIWNNAIDESLISEKPELLKLAVGYTQMPTTY